MANVLARAGLATPWLLIALVQGWQSLSCNSLIQRLWGRKKHRSSHNQCVAIMSPNCRVAIVVIMSHPVVVLVLHDSIALVLCTVFPGVFNVGDLRECSVQEARP